MGTFAPILLLLIAGVMWGVAIFGARAFAARKKREGKWNEKGPIDPSLPPPDFLQVYPQPWGIHRPVIESEEDENPFKYPVGKKHHHDEESD